MYSVLCQDKLQTARTIILSEETLEINCTAGVAGFQVSKISYWVQSTEKRTGATLDLVHG